MPKIDHNSDLKSRRNELNELRQRKIVERGLWIYALLVVCLTAVSWSVYLGDHRAALKRPVFKSEDRYKDLTNYAGKMAHLGDGAAALARGLPTYNYPPPAAYVYAFFLRGFPHRSVRAYLLVLGVGLVCGVGLLWKGADSGRKMRWGPIAAIAATAFFGLPALFTADRGNLEGVIVLILGTGLVLFVVRRYYSAAVFIGLAASIKPFPGLFLLLLLRKKLYREFAVGVTTVVCTTLLALTALGPNPIAAYRGLQPGVQQYYNDYIMKVRPRDEVRFTHSITDTLKSVASEWAHARENKKTGRLEEEQDAIDAAPQEPVPEALKLGNGMVRSRHYAQIHAIFILGMSLGAAVFVFTMLRFFKLPVLNQIILVGTLITLLPPVSAEYSLLELYVPFGLFVIFLVRDVATGGVEFSQRHMLILLTLFALLFSPLTFFGRYAGDVQMPLLACLLLAARTYPMPSSIFGEVEAGEIEKAEFGMAG
jgi:hypothetical protein